MKLRRVTNKKHSYQIFRTKKLLNKIINEVVFEEELHKRYATVIMSSLFVTLESVIDRASVLSGWERFLLRL